MKYIEAYHNKEIHDKLKAFENFGGDIDFKFFKIDTSTVKDEAHFQTAKHSIIALQKENQFFKITFDEQNLIGSGTKISLQEFLGPWFDFKLKKPILRGIKYPNSMFYYDNEEMHKNAINIHDSELVKKHTSDLHTNGFTQAFLDPPHGFSVSNTILDTGNYFINFCDFLFSDLNKIEIFKWNTDCSNYFDVGKEWWGTHFWTVYNPIKDYYIGILASTTD